MLQKEKIYHDFTLSSLNIYAANSHSASNSTNSSIINTMHNILAYYLIIINAVAFIVYGIDKYKAKKAKWRISEATLLMLAVLGGSIGAWTGMRVWHHKTMHKKFKYGVPVILLIQIAAMMYLHMNY